MANTVARLFAWVRGYALTPPSRILRFFSRVTIGGLQRVECHNLTPGASSTAENLSAFTSRALPGEAIRFDPLPGRLELALRR